ncbi:MAG: acyl-CoA/acyl-ACP dehydrogenase [Candidatus Eremiobacteraeota bacterium]|nr:acyl-CoA/acyl-ACP dehydrogenase [Candidatus Eremiobacteraeota bacterium]
MSLAEEIRRQAHEIGEATQAAPADTRSRVFFDGVRASRIPYLPCELQKDAGELYVRSYEALFLLGRASVPLAIGLTMHMYNLAALATLPVPNAPDFERRRQILVDTIRKYRSLLAISSFGENIKNKTDPFRNVVVTALPDGTYLCKGRKGFQSIASEADLLLFSGQIGEHQGMFYTSIKDRPELVVGPSLFAGAMAPSDTRPIEFNDLILKQRNVLSLHDDLTDHVSFYATAWFEALCSAVYLGGASRALEEVRRFGRSVHTEDDEMLADLDGFQLEVGRLALKLRSHLAMARSFGVCAELYCRLVREGAEAERLDRVANDLMDCGACIKWAGTAAAAEIVSGVRNLIGTRSMSVNHPLYPLYEQICFGPMHPTISARLERSAGETMLGEEPFTGLFEWALG